MGAFVTHHRYAIALTLLNVILTSTVIIWVRRPPGEPLQLIEPSGQIEVACLPDVGSTPSPAAATTTPPPAELVGNNKAEEQQTLSAAGGTVALATEGITPADSLPAKININQASEQELQALRGIGPALAGRIVEYRRTVGPFERVDDLTQVKGIGPVMLSRLRDLIVVR